MTARHNTITASDCGSLLQVTVHMHRIQLYSQVGHSQIWPGKGWLCDNFYAQASHRGLEVVALVTNEVKSGRKIRRLEADRSKPGTAPPRSKVELNQ